VEQPHPDRFDTPAVQEFVMQLHHSGPCPPTALFCTTCVALQSNRLDRWRCASGMLQRSRQMGIVIGRLHSQFNRPGRPVEDPARPFGRDSIRRQAILDAIAEQSGSLPDGSTGDRVVESVTLDPADDRFRGIQHTRLPGARLFHAWPQHCSLKRDPAWEGARASRPMPHSFSFPDPNRADNPACLPIRTEPRA
jgi:hypothetical protein